jgi:hypothetical protein
MITQHKIQGEVDERFLPGFKVCADDPATPVRSVTAQLLGKHFIQGKENPNPEAVELLIKLAKDSNNDVSFSAVYYGLSQIQNKSEAIISLLLDIAATNRKQELYDNIFQSLEKNRDQVIQLLEKKLTVTHDIAIFELYEDFTGKVPADATSFLMMPSSRPSLFVFESEEKDPEAAKAQLEKELASLGLENINLSVSDISDNFVLLLKTYLTKDRIAVKKEFPTSGTFKITQSMWLTPELEIQIDSMKKH